MQSRVKLSKRQIKEDKFTAFMFAARERLLTNWQFYAVGLVIVILAIVAVSYYISSQSDRAAAAELALTRAMGEYQQGQLQIAVLSLQNIISDYGSTETARQATFMLGMTNYRLKNYPEAARAFQEYLGKYKDQPLQLAAAQAGIAACHENQGEYQQAADALEAAIAMYPDNPQLSDYLLSALRCNLLAGSVDRAEEYFDRIQKDYSNTEVARQAQELLAELGAQG